MLYNILYFAPLMWVPRWGDAQDGAYIGPSAGATAVTALLTEDGAGSGGVLTVAFVGDSR